jgi:hypothetical protein
MAPNRNKRKGDQEPKSYSSLRAATEKNANEGRLTGYLGYAAGVDRHIQCVRDSDQRLGRKNVVLGSLRPMLGQRQRLVENFVLFDTVLSNQTFLSWNGLDQLSDATLKRP